MLPGIVMGVATLGLALSVAMAPRPLPPPPLQGTVERILIDKSDRTLQLIQYGRVVRTYPIGLGATPGGDKERLGDGRTPEGTFHIDLRNPQSQYHLSLRIDYPQPDDLARAAEGGYHPGGQIFIHGQPPGIRARARILGDWTNGCIAVTNANMDEIWRVTPVGTRVDIVP